MSNLEKTGFGCIDEKHLIEIEGGGTSGEVFSMVGDVYVVGAPKDGDVDRYTPWTYGHRGGYMVY